MLFLRVTKRRCKDVRLQELQVRSLRVVSESVSGMEITRNQQLMLRLGSWYAAILHPQTQLPQRMQAGMQDALWEVWSKLENRSLEEVVAYVQQAYQANSAEPVMCVTSELSVKQQREVSYLSGQQIIYEKFLYFVREGQQEA